MPTPLEILFLKDRAIKTAYNADPDNAAEIDYDVSEAETGVNTEPSWDRRNEAVALLAWHKYQVRERRAAQAAAGAGLGQVLERKLDNGTTKWAPVAKAFGPGPHGSTEPGAEFDELIELFPHVGEII